MGQMCGPLCGDDGYGYDRRHNLSTSWPSSNNTQISSDADANRKLDQLEMELRMLRDDNFRIREEQLRLDREMKLMPTTGAAPSSLMNTGPGGPPGGGNSRVDLEQQLSYMNDLVRSLQGENQKLRHGGGVGGGGGAEAAQLRERLAQLQQAHLRQLSETRALQSGANTPLAPGRGSFGAPIPNGAFTPGGSVDPNLLAQLQAAQAEQEALRSKVRKLAKN